MRFLNKSVLIIPLMIILFSILLYINHRVVGSLIDPPGLYKNALHIEYSFLIKNMKNRASRPSIFRVMAPVKRTAYQYLSRLSAGELYRLEEAPDGNQRMIFSIGSIPPYGKRLIRISADLLVSGKPIYFPKNGIENREDGILYADTHSPELMRVALSIPPGNRISTVNSIREWIDRNIKKTSYKRRPSGIQKTLIDRRGDCTDLSILFSGLCWIKGIPSRVVSGFIIRGSGILSPEDQHDWAEFYYDGTWHMVDFFRMIDDGGIPVAMRTIEKLDNSNSYNYRLFGIDGDGIVVSMNRY